MPNGVNQQFDFLLDGRGFMLARGRNKGRAWTRTSKMSVPGRVLTPGFGTPQEQLIFAHTETRYNTLQPEIRFKEPFDDFSGGDGYAYRDVSPPGVVHWSENMDCRFPGQAVHCQALLTASSFSWTPPVAVVRLADLPPNAIPNQVGQGYVAALSSRVSGAGLLNLNYIQMNGDRDIAGGQVLNRMFGGRPAIFGSYHYFGLATGNFVQGARDLSTFTDATNLPGVGFVNAGPKMWRYHGRPNGNACLVQSVAAGADPMTAGNWSATLTVGDGITPINDMIALDQQVFCGLPDGLYASDQSGTFVNVTGALAGAANAENCRDLEVHEGEVVFPAVGGLYAYNPTITSRARLRQIGPVQRSSRSPVIGGHRAVKSYGGWLYAGVWSGSASYLRAGREVSPGDWRWYTLNRLPAVSKINRVHVDGITVNVNGDAQIPNRMWIATDASVNYNGLAGTSPLYFMPIPRFNGNPLASDTLFSANYVGSARLVLPTIDRGAPGTPKIGEAVEVWADGFLSGSRYADVYYAVDRGPRTLLGRAQTSPVSTLLMGSTNGSFPTFRALEVDIESYNTTPGTCQVYRSIVVTGNLRPDYVETIEAVVAIADGTPDRRGTPMRPGSVQIDDLRDLAHPLRHGSVPHQLIDLAGATSYVVFDGMPVESETYQEGSESPEVTASITMVVLTLSANQG